MMILTIGLILFLGIHAISIVALPLRDRLAAKSPLGWKGFYSLVSAVGIILIALGYSMARLDPVLIYTTPYGLRHLTYLLMLPAMMLFIAPYFPGRIKQVTKHPQLIAVKLWACSHLLVNGTLADIILFGAFLAWAVLDRISMKKRQQRPLPGLPTSWINDVLVVVIGTVLTGAFIMFLHGYLIGMPLVG
jgi:uncharacterized membrane protein